MAGIRASSHRGAAISALSEIDGPMMATAPSSTSSPNARTMSCSDPDGRPRACLSTSSISRSSRPVASPRPVVCGEERIEIGAGTTIGPLASISAGMPSQMGMRGDPVITIGDRCSLGKGIGIVGHERIEIGDDIWTGHYVYVTDQNHGYEDLDLPIGTQMWKNEPVSIGDGSWLGHGAIVLPGSQIGRHVVIAAGAVVTGIEVPDFSVI